MRKSIALITIFFLQLLVPAHMPAQDQSNTTIVQVPVEKKKTFFQKLQNEQWSQLRISTDFDQLTADIYAKNRQPALLELENPAGKVLSLEIEVELRGKTRRKICDQPPLRLIFPKDTLSGLGLSKKGDKLKLVTHCLEEEGSEQTLLREYWTYRLYNKITPISLQVHLIQIIYHNTGPGGEESEKRLAFILESEEELARRLDGDDEDIWGLTPAMVDRKTYQYNMLFQYMIGNDDWTLRGNRNLVFIQPDHGGLPLVVPFDFDFSGMVDAPYAVPNPNLGLDKITDRIAMGKFDSREELEEVTQHFFRLRDEQLQCFRECPWLDKDSKKKMTKYLDSFFGTLENSRRLERIFLNN